MIAFWVILLESGRAPNKIHWYASNTSTPTRRHREGDEEVPREVPPAAQLGGSRAAGESAESGPAPRQDRHHRRSAYHMRVAYACFAHLSHACCTCLFCTQQLPVPHACHMSVTVSPTWETDTYVPVFVRTCPDIGTYLSSRF